MDIHYSIWLCKEKQWVEHCIISDMFTCGLLFQLTSTMKNQLSMFDLFKVDVIIVLCHVTCSCHAMVLSNNQSLTAFLYTIKYCNVYPMEGCDFGKRALQCVKNYEKGQYSYFQLLNIKNVFKHYISSSLHQIQCIYMTHCLYIFYYICTSDWSVF
jgi:hypothetical protein